MICGGGGVVRGAGRIVANIAKIIRLGGLKKIFLAGVFTRYALCPYIHAPHSRWGDSFGQI
jgi:hypothetical protein